MPPTENLSRRLLLFTKPARAGRVKTRLVGDLTAEQAAELHAAFVADLLARLKEAPCELHLAWALDEGEEIPRLPGLPGLRQEGADLGERLYAALSSAAREARVVAALGSDHPTLAVEIVERAFAAVEAGARVVLGPAEDGGYYLIALAAPVPRRLFEAIDWSTPRVLAQTLARCAELGIAPELLPEAADVDTPEDLERLARRMAASDLGCPRTRSLLAEWGRLPIGDNVDPERAGRGSSPLGGGGLGKGGGQEGGGCNGVRSAPLLASPLPQPPPSQGGGTHRPASADEELSPMGQLPVEVVRP